jgi:hypothetical protein
MTYNTAQAVLPHYPALIPRLRRTWFAPCRVDFKLLPNDVYRHVTQPTRSWTVLIASISEKA